MKVKTTKRYISFTGQEFDSEEKAAADEQAFLDMVGIPEWLDGYVKEKGYGGRTAAVIRAAVIDYALRPEEGEEGVFQEVSNA